MQIATIVKPYFKVLLIFQGFMKKSALILSLVATLAVLTACGGGGSDSSTTATSETPAAAPATDGSCKIVDGIYQVTIAGCKAPDNAVCTSSGITVTGPNNGFTYSSGPTGTLNLNGTKYKCAA
jgi:ABC-type phosphate transport system substrate-binding protein